MRKSVFVLFAAVLALPLAAQPERPRAQGFGYFGVFGGNGVTMGKLLNPGMGADVFVYKGLAASVDLGYLGYYNNFQSDGVGLFSSNASYHFFNSTKFVPFITAGYGLEFRGGTAHLGNYGGGVTYWMNKHCGFRVEGRDFHGDFGNHFGGLRVGFSFR